MRELCLAAILAAMPVTQAAADGASRQLECRLSLPAQVRAGSPVPLTFELINRGASRLHILSWNTPLEGWFGKFLRVSRDDQEVPYRGPMVKRGRPEPADYITLRPGATTHSIVDLTQVYAIGTPGRYSVVFDGRLHDVTTRAPSREQQSPLEIDCGSATVEVTAG